MREGLENICSVNPENLGAATPQEYLFKYIDISSVDKGRIHWGQVNRYKFSEAPSRARRRIREGDVLLCTVRPGLQAHARISVDEGVPFVASTGFAVLRPSTKEDSSFIFHQIFSNDVVAQLRAKEVGSNYPAVNESDVKRLSIFMPGPSQRQAIGKVLDTIDEAIARTETVIAKLKQVRAGMLHDLLSYGLDEDGQLRDPATHPEQFKDSPLGLIPVDWEPRSLRQITEYISYGFTNPMPTTFDGPLMLTAFDIGDGVINADGARHTSQNAFNTRLSAKSRPIVGDILITKDGTLGRVAVLNIENVCINQSIAVLRPIKDTDTNFLLQYLRSPSGQKAMLAEAGGSTIRHIYITKLAEVLIPYPKSNERSMITKLLVTSEVQIKAEGAGLDKLKSLKSGLQDDLLTGRVRVPEIIMEGTEHE